jgi:hypothetical protein
VAERKKKLHNKIYATLAVTSAAAAHIAVLAKQHFISYEKKAKERVARTLLFCINPFHAS